MPYDAAWKHLRDTGTTPGQVAVLKKNLAQIILASACKGEREVEQLKAIALKRSVSGAARRRPEDAHRRRRCSSLWCEHLPFGVSIFSGMSIFAVQRPFKGSPSFASGLERFPA